MITAAKKIATYILLVSTQLGDAVIEARSIVDDEGCGCPVPSDRIGDRCSLGVEPSC